MQGLRDAYQIKCVVGEGRPLRRADSVADLGVHKGVLKLVRAYVRCVYFVKKFGQAERGLSIATRAVPSTPRLSALRGQKPVEVRRVARAHGSIVARAHIKRV